MSDVSKFDLSAALSLPEGAVAPPSTARERVEKLLHALKLEVQVGIITGELLPLLSYRFYTVSADNPEQSILCEVSTRVVERYSIPPEDKAFPRLIEGNGQS